VRVVLGYETWVQVPTLATIELDFIQVKGKTSGVRIFALLGDEELAKEPDFLAYKTKVEEMLAIYKSQDWAGARLAVDEARKAGQSFMAMVDAQRKSDASQDGGGAAVLVSEDPNACAAFTVDDTFYKLYEDRIADYEINPPGEDWDGVFVATTK